MSTLRPIDISDFAPIARPENFGAAPQLQWLKIADLVVDSDYQRDIGKERRTVIRAIAEHFNWSYFSTVMVSPVEGGFYAIIDGMGRTTAAALCGFETVPCAVIVADKREQARAFADIDLDRLWREASAEAHQNRNFQTKDILCGALVDVLAQRYDEE